MATYKSILDLPGLDPTFRSDPNLLKAYPGGVDFEEGMDVNPVIKSKMDLENPTLGFEPWLSGPRETRTSGPVTPSSTTSSPEPTFAGTTTPMGNIARGALSSYSDFRNRLNIPRIGNTEVANLIRGRAGRTAEDEIGRFTDIRKNLNAPRLQDTDVAKMIREGLIDPSSTPGFKLGQNLINERGRTQREDFLSSIGRAGLGGSGIALKGLNTLGRQGDIDIGNLALNEGVNTRNAAMSFAPKVEDAFWTEMNKALGLEEQGVSDLFSLEKESQRGFENELGLGLRQEENVKNREMLLKIQEMKNQGMLGTAAGNLLSQALPQILQALGLGMAPNAIEKALGLPAGTIEKLTKGAGQGETDGTGGIGKSVASTAIQQAIKYLMSQGASPDTAQLIAQYIDPALKAAGITIPTEADISAMARKIIEEGGLFGGESGGIIEDAASGIGDFVPDPWGTGPDDLSWLDSIGQGGENFVPDTWGTGPGDLDWLSDFSNASTGAAGIGAEAAAGFGEFTPEILEAIEAGYGGIVGAGEGAGLLSSIGAFATPLGIIGAGYGIGSLMAKLFGFGNSGAEWDKKARGWSQKEAQEISSDPEGWLAKLEKTYGSGGRKAGELALRGELKGAQHAKEVLGIGDLPVSNMTWNSMGVTGPFEQATTLAWFLNSAQPYFERQDWFRHQATLPIDQMDLDYKRTVLGIDNSEES